MTTLRAGYLALVFASAGCGGAVDSVSNVPPASGSGGGGGGGSGGMVSTLPIRCDSGAFCDDGNACTIDDTCQAGQCRGAPSPACGPIVHEWGTYTSVHATDGHALGGVHHIDEALPAWVHRRQLTPQSYNFEVLPEEPKEQLETPVLYFHSAGVEQVHVEVGFPQGIVGEWFPDATSFAPAVMQMQELGHGAMSWDVTLDPGIQPESFLPVDPQEIWAPSRNVDSTPLSAISQDGIEEREQFIFYRGLAKFAPELETSVSADGTITLSNGSALPIARVFLLRASKKGGSFVDLGVLGPHASVSAPTPIVEDSLDEFSSAARSGLGDALIETGLYPDEAEAMVETWTRSWFENQGLRVLYLAPRAWADAWLPMTITPAPAELTRTLVGRVELLTFAEEQKLVTDLTVAAASNAPLSLESLGRFAEPRLTRAIEQLDGSARDLAQQLKDQVHAQP